MKLIPLLSEKTLKQSPRGTYVFKVPLALTKPQIAQTVEQLFGVSVVSVRTLRVRPQRVLFRKIPGMTAEVKKAIVTLKHGERIPGFELTQTKKSDKDEAGENKEKA